ncbi:hypothetical protein HOLDEFILI_00966 [Holdemania filiformis DSM 12042]|uniref:Uncharacterized protein n=1 Tax=Holdemania filiformis DSM 12042 TaxID=545696 RepID=B9Y584_9FIRM|nr:hypothetical protein HOLDEFILI_00966 [Holdemania filiformis DSM 12042]
MFSSSFQLLNNLNYFLFIYCFLFLFTGLRSILLFPTICMINKLKKSYIY